MWLYEKAKEANVNGLLVVFVILATVITYLVIRLIAIWNASHTDKRGKD